MSILTTADLWVNVSIFAQIIAQCLMGMKDCVCINQRSLVGKEIFMEFFDPWGNSIVLIICYQGNSLKAQAQACCEEWCGEGFLKGKKTTRSSIFVQVTKKLGCSAKLNWVR